MATDRPRLLKLFRTYRDKISSEEDVVKWTENFVRVFDYRDPNSPFYRRQIDVQIISVEISARLIGRLNQANTEEERKKLEKARAIFDAFYETAFEHFEHLSKRAKDELTKEKALRALRRERQGLPSHISFPLLGGARNMNPGWEGGGDLFPGVAPEPPDPARTRLQEQLDRIEERLIRPTEAIGAAGELVSLLDFENIEYQKSFMRPLSKSEAENFFKAALELLEHARIRAAPASQRVFEEAEEIIEERVSGL